MTDPRDLSLLDVIEAVEGPTADGVCVMNAGPCPAPGCAIHEAWMAARADLLARLEHLSLHDVVGVLAGAAATTALSEPPVKEES